MVLISSLILNKPSTRAELLEKIGKLLYVIGQTPIKCFNIGSYKLCMKLEYINPTGSHKDRIALYMVKRAAEEGIVKPGDCIAEISSGNTATSVAWVASRLGLKALLFVEKHASETKKNLIRSLGGQLVEIGDEGKDRGWAMEEAERRGCYLLDQMSNDANHFAHYETTAMEILVQVGEWIDAFVMGVGTAGTVTGVGRRLKETIGSTLVVSVSPKDSPIVGGKGEGETIEGLTVSIVPELYKKYGKYVDKAIGVDPGDAIIGVSVLASVTGILPGPSTGAAFVAATRLIEQGLLDRGSTILIIAADRILRYPSILRKLRVGANGTELLKIWQQ
ncbi:PLP-dependent cysteine synthase family protein [Pyrofollis japonicus]|uniref:PLP-dependent cysteine synthase family protein n=1 Tax=Pyrofollis japonicus TaxID=3060460 RepID=UPI00295AEDBB|nr:cysteine synthase family protein [Pyrofollis japonicus]